MSRTNGYWGHGEGERALGVTDVSNEIFWNSIFTSSAMGDDVLLKAKPQNMTSYCLL
jgi:hypothetical protein